MSISIIRTITIRIFIALMLAFVSVSGSYAQPAPTQTDKNIPPVDLPKKEILLKVQKDDFVIGNKKAPVTIIEYASLTCSHCADFYNNTFEALKKKYIDTGKVRFIYRDFPLNEPAMRGSMLVNCAPKENKEKFLKVLFSTQNNWAFKKNYLEVLSNIAKLGGMPQKNFEACIANKELEHSIAKTRFFAAKVLEIRATPSFYINGTVHDGAKDLTYFSSVIDPLLGIKPIIQKKEPSNTPNGKETIPHLPAETSKTTDTQPKTPAPTPAGQ